jgi:hypothetical protein
MQLSVRDTKRLRTHAASAAHVSAVESGRVPEPKVVTWIREHGDANTISLVSNDETTATRQRVHVVKCGACRMDIRAIQLNHLLNHVDSAAHVAALESGRAPEYKVNAWIREHGEANTMSLVSNDEMSASGNRVYAVKCGACSKEMRVRGATHLQCHVDSATHVAALHSKTERLALRKRPRC